MNKKIYLVTPPGFERVAAQELVLKGFEFDQVTLLKGGVEIEVPTSDEERPHELILDLSHKMKVPTRILERLVSSRIRDFPKLFKFISGLEQDLFPKEVRSLSLSVSCRRSRLMNKKRIEKTVGEGLIKLLPGLKLQNSKAENAPTLFVRFEDDICELSMNHFSPFMFKRGYKALEGAAPIRENIAAGLTLKLHQCAGSPKEFQLIDPMCGTGTLLTEALMLFNDFVQRVSVSVLGFEKDLKAVNLGQQNLESLNKLLSEPLSEALVKKGFCHGGIDQGDFFQELPVRAHQLQAKKVIPRLVICNPPYGLRLKLPESPRSYYPRLLERFRGLEPDVLGFIVPQKFGRYLPEPEDQIDFKNGGYPVQFKIYKAV